MQKQFARAAGVAGLPDNLRKSANHLFFLVMKPASLFPSFLVALALCGTAPASRADIDRTQPPKPGPEPKASFADFKQDVLPNGLKIFTVEDHREPTITFRLLIKAGDAYDQGRPGLADTTASLLNHGTRKRSAEQFAKETDFIGASVEGGSGQDAITVSAEGLTKDLPKILDLFADAALHPVFPADELVKQQRQAISALEESKQRPGTLASKLRGKLLYGPDHPYGAYPTEESLSGLRREDLEKFHDEFFTPGNATLAIVGDIRPADVLPLVEKAFADWKSTATDANRQPTFPDLPKPPETLTIHLVDRPGSVQSNILVCGRGVARNNPDVPELGVLNSILGGGFSGRLFQNLREKHGYTYGSSSGFSYNRIAGIFSATAEVRNAVTVPAIEEIFNEVKRIDAEPVPGPELAMQREYLAGNYLLSLESPATTAMRVQDIDLYKLPVDYYKTYVSRVTSVDADKIKALADKYVNPAGLTVVVVGEAKDIKPALEKLGPVVVYDTDLKAQPSSQK